MYGNVKIVFEPGCFDGFEGTQEELDELVEMIRKMAESGELFEQGTPITEINLSEVSEEVAEWLSEEFGTGEDPEERRRRLN